MNSELEAYFAAARTAGVESREDTQMLQKKQVDFPERFLEKADALLKPVMDSTAETLQRHGYGATVEMVRDQSGSDPEYLPIRYPALFGGAAVRLPTWATFTPWQGLRSASFAGGTICAWKWWPPTRPAGAVERRVNFSTLSLGDLTHERVNGIVTDAVKQIIRL